MNFLLRVSDTLSGFPVVRSDIKSSLYLTLKGSYKNKQNKMNNKNTNKKITARDIRNFPSEEYEIQ